MDFEERKQKALAIMASRKMWKSNYAPPLIRLLWWLGVKIPLLPFASFWQVFGLMTGGFSGVYVPPESDAGSAAGSQTINRVSV